MSESLIGIECRMYYRTGGTLADALSAASFASEFTLLSKLRDVRAGIAWGRADLSSRASKFSAKRPSIADWVIEADSTWKPDDTGLEALMAACWAGTLLEIVLFDGPAAPASGDVYRRCSAYVFEADDNQPLADGENISWVFEPSETLPPERDTLPV